MPGGKAESRSVGKPGRLAQATQSKPVAAMAIPAAFQGAEKLKFLSFPGAQRAEESLFFLRLNQREMPHFVRNGKINYFFRSLINREFALAQIS